MELCMPLARALPLALPLTVALGLVLVPAVGSAPALSWSSGAGSDSSGSGADAAQPSDPDDAVENFANPSVAGQATELSVQTEGAGSARPVETKPSASDAEPVNPGWPMWMVWHQN